METVAPIKEISDLIKEKGGASFDVCYQCGICDVVCPWNRVRPFSMRKIVRQATFGLTEIEGEDIWRCTTCGTCPQRCPRGVDQIKLGVSLRRIATEYGVFPDSVAPVVTVAGSLNRKHIKGPAQFIEHKSSKRLAVHVFCDYEQLFLSRLRQFLQKR